MNNVDFIIISRIMTKKQRKQPLVKFMVIEEDELCSLFINSILATENFKNIGTAKTIKDIEFLFNTYDPDLIISNIYLNESCISEVILREKYLDVPILLYAKELEDENISKFSYHKKSILMSKPINKHSLMSSVQFLLNVFPPKRFDLLEVKSNIDGQKVKIMNKDILFVEAEGNYITLHTVNNQVYKRKKALKNIQKELSKGFIQINKSYVINTHHIQRLEFGKGQLVLTNKKILKIGRSYRKQLEQFLLKEYNY